MRLTNVMIFESRQPPNLDDSERRDDKSDAKSSAELIRIFDATRTPLLRYLLAFPLAISDAEDVLHEVFLSLFQQIRNGKSPSHVQGWLFRAAYNQPLKKSFQSRSQRQKFSCLAVIEDIAVDPGSDPEHTFHLNETQRRLRSVIRALPG